MRWGCPIELVDVQLRLHMGAILSRRQHTVLELRPKQIDGRRIRIFGNLFGAMAVIVWICNHAASSGGRADLACKGRHAGRAWVV